ncbi:hypothetical protein [uncultured Gemmiger sp.]|uniref:hypothetical protein n=1 Tax=uncultured Gemmiger sp. TaxID=1623490 RepID=UPI0025EDC73E|nr:hypothetical protein [uncultured Gemmiger sp.]
MTTNSTSNRMPRLLAMLFLLLGLFCAAALPAHAEDDYNTTLDRLSRLQALAREFSSSRDDAPDPIALTLSYTRTGDYNTTIWQLTAGVRDTEFESYVSSSDAELASLQSLHTVTLPTGEKIDFGHLLASMNLVYNGIPITGSWGGDCQQLAQQYYGQAQDAAGYAAAMRATFNMDDDGSLSKFGDQDLRADMDSVIVGSKVTQDTDLADALRSYYENLTEYDRAKEFISLSFGTQDTSNRSFADAVYRALLDDSGMQLLFYMNGMWSVNGWQIKEDYAPAVRGAADLFAEYLAGAVNHEKVKSETNDRLVAMGGQALSDALAALGDSDAAAAALAAANELADSTQSAVSSGSDAISAARDTLQTKFDVKIFQLILLIAAAAAAFMLVFSLAMFVLHRRDS